MAESQKCASSSIESSGCSSDDEDLSQEEYDAKRDVHLRRLILAENQFNDIKHKIREIKLRQLTELRDRIIRREAPEYLEREKFLLKDHEERQRVLEVKRNLQIDSLERVTAARKMIVQQARKEYEENIYEQIREQLLNEVESLERAKRQKQQTMARFGYETTGKADPPNALSSAQYVSAREAQSRLTFPVIFHQLSAIDLAEDLDVMQTAINETDLHEANHIAAQ